MQNRRLVATTPWPLNVPDPWDATATPAPPPQLLDPRMLMRYRAPRRRFPGEFRLRLAGPLHGKHILDLGCHEGRDTVLLARLGAARVIGVDPSAQAIDRARACARANGVADRTEFLCASIERVDLPVRAFDLVWCNAELLQSAVQLERVLRRMARWAKPNGLLTFAEPTSLHTAWHRPMPPLRLSGPKPLGASELALVRHYVPDLRMRHFGFLGTAGTSLQIGVLPEPGSLPQRALRHFGAALDWLILSLPLLDRYGSTTVMWGHPTTTSCYLQRC